MEFSIVWSFSLLGRELVLFTAQQLSSNSNVIDVITCGAGKKIWSVIYVIDVISVIKKLLVLKRPM